MPMSFSSASVTVPVSMSLGLFVPHCLLNSRRSASSESTSKEALTVVCCPNEPRPRALTASKGRVQSAFHGFSLLAFRALHLAIMRCTRARPVTIDHQSRRPPSNKTVSKTQPPSLVYLPPAKEGSPGILRKDGSPGILRCRSKSSWWARLSPEGRILLTGGPQAGSDRETASGELGEETSAVQCTEECAGALLNFIARGSC
mmetsp:Transcript_7927/g.29338  ORF Transcript_7927/g.29338 Transcript_7927/m.29338 type:complete len:202 (-) Transcript_7927:83-688(-)